MLRVRAGGHSGVRVRVVTRASVGVMVRFYFGVVLVIFSQFYVSALLRCGMGTELGLRLGSGVRIKVRVKVSLRVKFLLLFCRSIVLFLVFYAFRLYNQQFRVIPLPIPAGGI